MEEIAEANHRLGRLFNTLGNGIRIDILEFIRTEEEVYVKAIADEMNRASSTTSRHLRILADYDLVQAITRGRKKFFKIKRPDLVDACLAIRQFLQRTDQ